MVNMTRLDCVLGSAAGMANGVAHAVHHATHRSAFGARLVDQPLLTNVLADLAIEAEAATVTALRLAAAVDAAERGDENEATLRRLGIAVTKYWVCKRAPAHAAEALECLGSNGYVEESGMPRLFRESPLPGIWEGSGNVAALDTLRAMARQPEVVQAFFGEVELAAGADTRFDDALARVRKELTQLDDIEYGRGGSWSRWRSSCRAPCCCATAIRPSPPRSARRASTATAGSPSARCPPGWTPRRSSTERGPACSMSPA